MKQPKFPPYYTTQVAGRPPTLRELDGKLISLLHSIRSRGGVLNFSVVKASALSLVNSNSSANLSGFEATALWVRSIYKRCNFSRRAGTTTRPPVPRGIYEECKLTYLTDINRAITQHNIPPELVINADQTPCSYNGPVQFFCSAHKRPYRQEEYYFNFRYFVVWLFFANADHLPGENRCQLAKGI